LQDSTNHNEKKTHNCARFFNLIKPFSGDLLKHGHELFSNSPQKPSCGGVRITLSNFAVALITITFFLIEFLIKAFCVWIKLLPRTTVTSHMASVLCFEVSLTGARCRPVAVCPTHHGFDRRVSKFCLQTDRILTARSFSTSGQSFRRSLLLVQSKSLLPSSLLIFLEQFGYFGQNLEIFHGSEIS